MKGSYLGSVQQKLFGMNFQTQILGCIITVKQLLTKLNVSETTTINLTLESNGKSFYISWMKGNDHITICDSSGNVMSMDFDIIEKIVEEKLRRG